VNSLNKKNSNILSSSANIRNPTTPINFSNRDMESTNPSQNLISPKATTNSPLEAVKLELEKHAKIQNKTLTLTPEPLNTINKDDDKSKRSSNNEDVLILKNFLSPTSNLTSLSNSPIKKSANIKEIGAKSDLNATQDKTKSRTLSTSSSSSSKVNFPSNKHGFIQINDKVYPYVCLFDYGYRCTSTSTSIGVSKYPICFKYISVKQLVESKIIPIELYSDKSEMEKKFKTFRLASKEYLHMFNDQILKMQNLKIETNHVIFSDTLELVNLVELYINFSTKALYLQELELESIPRRFLENYERVLSFTGGILQYKSPNNKKKQILPFIDFEDKKLVISSSIRIALEAYAQTIDNKKNDVNIEVFELNGDKLNLRDVTDFFKLILTYICIDNAKFNSSMKLINIQKWLKMFPQKLNVLCCFTPKFPHDWIEAFNRNETG
jgi:hypothetical protein